LEELLLISIDCREKNKGILQVILLIAVEIIVPFFCITCDVMLKEGKQQNTLQ
jgi:hypothetical protein